MTIANPPPLGLDYSAIVLIVDTISSQTGLRTIHDFEMLLAGMGGRIERVSVKKWSAPDSTVLEITAPKTFVVHLPLDPTPLDRLLLACALGHYILHSKEGSAASKFYRFAKDQTSLEALWFGMAVVIPDQAFAVAESTQDLDEGIVATLFNVPKELIALKRKLVASAAAKAQAETAAV